MRTREKVELVLIAFAVTAVGLCSHLFPQRLTVGELLVVGCLAWLVQGGGRDLVYLYEMKRRRSKGPNRKLACMCLESSAGLAGLLAGIALTLAGFGRELELNPLRWMLFAASVFTLGFLLKDIIISWRPLGLRRDPEHHSIIFTWW